MVSTQRVNISHIAQTYLNTLEIVIAYSDEEIHYLIEYTKNKLIRHKRTIAIAIDRDIPVYTTFTCIIDRKMISQSELPGKHETSTYCWNNAGPPSTTLAHHWSNIIGYLVFAG